MRDDLSTSSWPARGVVRVLLARPKFAGDIGGCVRAERNASSRDSASDRVNRCRLPSLGDYAAAHGTGNSPRRDGMFSCGLFARNDGAHQRVLQSRPEMALIGAVVT